MHGAEVVGHPKQLSDLDRIEADVRITCRRCGFEQDWTVADLSRHLLAIGGSTVWSEITRKLRCGHFQCREPNLRASPVPYARRQANLPRRIGALDVKTLETTMQVLEEAHASQRVSSVATRELRLALLVVHRYARNREAVKLFWERASLANPGVNDTLDEPLRLIRLSLEARGWLAPKYRQVRSRTSPRPKPPPQGWPPSPARPRHQNDD